MVASAVITTIITFLASDAFKYFIKSSVALAFGAYFKSYFPSLTWNSIFLFFIGFGWTILVIWFFFSFLGSVLYGSDKGLLN